MFGQPIAMIYLPPLRRFLVPALTILAFILLYKSSFHVPNAIPSFVLHQPPPPPEGIRVPISDLKPHIFPISNISGNHLSPPHEHYYSHTKEPTSKSINGSLPISTWSRPIFNPYLASLFECPVRPNRYTNHIRLANIVQNISLIPSNPVKDDKRVYWNPTIVSLPYWSENRYLVVSRIVTDGNHQENVLCEANICYVGSGKGSKEGEKQCSEDDIGYVGIAGGMRCATAPVTLSVPPTPAEKCEGKFGTYVDIPGFHDPRIFWSGKGEPLMMVNTQ